MVAGPVTAEHDAIAASLHILRYALHSLLATASSLSIILICSAILAIVWRHFHFARRLKHVAASRRITWPLLLSGTALITGVAFYFLFPHYMKRIAGSRITEFLSFLVALLAIGFAIKADWTLDDIRASVQTRFIGVFPDYLGAVCDLIKSADADIFILGDAVDHGSFCNPRLHERTVQAQRDAAHNGKRIVIVMVGSDSPVALSRANRYGTCQSPNGITIPWDKPAFVEHLTAWAEYHAIPRDYICNASNGGALLKELLLAVHDEVARKLTCRTNENIAILRNASPGQELNLFLWIADKERAIFLIPDLHSAADGVAFQTHDPQLVTTLRAVFDGYKNKATKYDPMHETVENIVTSSNREQSAGTATSTD